MVFQITTKDGITIQNIPDDIDPNSQQLKDRVSKIRDQRKSGDDIQDEVITSPTVKDDVSFESTSVLDNLGITNVAPVEGEPGFVDRAVDAFDSALVGGTEAALALGSGIAAEPIAGARAIFDTLKESIAGDLDIFGEGAFTPESREAGQRIIKNIEETKKAFTFEPRTREGQEAITAVGKAIEPIAKGVAAVESFIGNNVLEKTGSPALAALSEALPSLATELGIFKGSKALSRRKNLKQETQLTKELSEAAPTSNELREVAGVIYDELDSSGVVFKKDPVRKAAREMIEVARKMGIRGKQDATLAPKSFQGIVRFAEDAARGDITLKEMDTLRKILKRGTESIDNSLERSISGQAIDILDEFVNSTDTTSLRFVDADGIKVPRATVEAQGGLPPKELPKQAVEIPGIDVGGKYKVARDLWGRAKRSELLQEAFDKAGLQASGFENGIVSQFRSILNNPKRSRFFGENEKAAMRAVVKGEGTKRNLYKFLGRAGGFEGVSTNFLGTIGGSAVGNALFGPAGAVIVPMIGVVSKGMASRLTKRGAKFADEVVRSGKNARLIAKAYKRNTPNKQQSAAELSQLLMDPKVDISDLVGDQLAVDAAKIAAQNRNAISNALTIQSAIQVEGESRQVDEVVP